MNGNTPSSTDNQLTALLTRLSNEIKVKEQELEELSEKYENALRYQQERSQGIHNVLLARKVFSY